MKSQSEIKKAIITCEEFYAAITDTQERNELQVALCILRRNYTASHYKGTLYEFIANATEAFMKDDTKDWTEIMHHNYPPADNYTEEEFLNDAI
ncbi:MAG: hypothetical protein IPO78_17160 [Saprospiraceae bacterium]|nr:hypothetical protein [Saprospiraceae bacterium]